MRPRGELLVRAVRYGFTLFVGYLAGAVVGSSVRGPALPVLCALGALLLVLVFRRGVASQNHAAMDAILEARATAQAAANAAAVATQSVTIAGGDVVTPSTGAGEQASFPQMSAQELEALRALLRSRDAMGAIDAQVVPDRAIGAGEVREVEQQ